MIPVFASRSAGLAVILVLAVPAPAVRAQESPITLAPHRAVYDLALARTRGNSQIAAVRGRILYDFDGNACDGYSLQFRQVSELDSGEGKVSTSDLRSTTWEGGDAKSFKFSSENFLNQNSRRYRRRPCRAWHGRDRRQSREAEGAGDRPRRRRRIPDPADGARDRGGPRRKEHS